MNNNASNSLWAKLVALNPGKEDIHLFSQPEILDESYKPNTGCTISQKSTGDTWIMNLSASSINIDGDWLDTNREKEIFSGQRISFNRDRDSQDEYFDYVFHIMNSQAKHSNKRKKEESLKPQMVLSNLETTKLAKIRKGRKKRLSRRVFEFEGTIHKGNNWTYIGVYRNGKKEGKGSFIYPKGNIYEGTWLDDKREGKGSLTFPSGDICKGRWWNDVVQNIDEIIFANKGVYKGKTKGFNAHGKGVLNYFSGRIYDGSFVGDRIEGFGKMIYNNGDEYEGDWKAEKRSGTGKMKYANGQIYEGEWKDDGREGNGTITLANADKYQGIWKDDVLESVRKMYYANGDTYKGEVQIENLIRQGKGVLIFKNGDRYEGEWNNDKKHGNGREVCRDGELIYEGVWKEGKMSEVIMTDADGIRYKVKWEKLDEGEQINKKQGSDGRQYQEDLMNESF